MKTQNVYICGATQTAIGRYGGGYGYRYGGRYGGRLSSVRPDDMALYDMALSVGAV